MSNKKIVDSLYNVTKCIICFYIFLESAYIQRLIIKMFHITNLTDSIKTILSAVSNICIMIIFFFIYRKELIKEWKIFKKNYKDNLDISFKYWIYGLIGMILSNIIITLIFGSSQSNNEQALRKLINAVPFVMLINAGIIGPINEEIIFRKGFKNVFKNKWLFILISGIFFGMMHVISATTINQFLYFIPYSCLGVSFGIMYYKTDTIYTSLFAHMFHNIILTTLNIILI